MPHVWRWLETPWKSPLKPTIASEGSPVPEIYQRLYGCATYAQDLAYAPGLHGNRIGSDAAALPLPDGSVTGIALHCSLEHFERDSDTGFIREAARILRIGGKVVIVPLYLHSTYSVVTDPLVSRGAHVDFEPDAVVMAVKGWGNRHGRFYDPAHLAARILSGTQAMVFRLSRLTNAGEVSASAYARFALVGTRIDLAIQPAPPNPDFSRSVKYAG